MPTRTLAKTDAHAVNFETVKAMSFFEALMLICFGAAWPASIYRSYKSQTTAGKSLAFLIIVEIGYISGIIYKLSSSFDNIIWLYILNAIMVLADIALYWKNYQRQNCNKTA